jgi:NAD(P)H-quinone oxidoreductase subunit 5
VSDVIYFWYCWIIIGAPMLLLAFFGIAALFDLKASETVISRLTQATVGLSLFTTCMAFMSMLIDGRRFVPIDLGDWVVISEQHFQFHLKFIFDRLSIAFLLLSLVLCGVVGAFTRRYLHRETGYRRFFLLYTLFLNGMILSSIAGTIETLFFGWELVGVSSALLVAYFHQRENPVTNGLRVWAVYRFSDAAFLLAALLMHHLKGHGDFANFTGEGPWPWGETDIESHHALQVGLLLLLAAAGKSALLPFSGWLPRAMEGPTPSSAVFYGSLSVHLGAYLLLRVSPLIHESFILEVIVIAMGLSSALMGAVLSRVQTDVKSALAFASLTQVGIIVAEIGFGLHYLALCHIIGHACLRTLQLLRAPTLLTDYHAIENAIGSQIEGSAASNWIPERFRTRLYRFALERGFLDQAIDSWIVSPMKAVFRWSDRQERRWTDWLSKEPSRESDLTPRHPEET